LYRQAINVADIVARYDTSRIGVSLRTVIRLEFNRDIPRLAVFRHNPDRAVHPIRPVYRLTVHRQIDRLLMPVVDQQFSIAAVQVAALNLEINSLDIIDPVDLLFRMIYRYRHGLV